MPTLHTFPAFPCTARSSARATGCDKCSDNGWQWWSGWKGGKGAAYDADRKHWKKTEEYAKTLDIERRREIRNKARAEYVTEVKSDLSGWLGSVYEGQRTSARVSQVYSALKGRHIGSGAHCRPGKKPIYYDIYDRNGKLYYIYK